MHKKPRAIIGCGNLLMSDEGAGVHAIEKLSNEKWPDDVELIDAGTPSLSILHMIDGRELVVIIDCADMGKLPGEVAVFSPEEIETDSHSISGLHAADLAQVLKLVHTLKSPPKKIAIIGVQPKKVEMGSKLSDEVLRSIDLIRRNIIQLLER